MVLLAGDFHSFLSLLQLLLDHLQGHLALNLLVLQLLQELGLYEKLQVKCLLLKGQLLIGAAAGGPGTGHTAPAESEPLESSVPLSPSCLSTSLQLAHFLASSFLMCCCDCRAPVSSSLLFVSFMKSWGSLISCSLSSLFYKSAQLMVVQPFSIISRFFRLLFPELCHPLW